MCESEPRIPFHLAVRECEDMFSRLWVECQRCQGSLHQDVLCTRWGGWGWGSAGRLVCWILAYYDGPCGCMNGALAPFILTKMHHPFFDALVCHVFCCRVAHTNQTLVPNCAPNATSEAACSVHCTHAVATAPSSTAGRRRRRTWRKRTACSRDSTSDASSRKGLCGALHCATVIHNATHA